MTALRAAAVSLVLLLPTAARSQEMQAPSGRRKPAVAFLSSLVVPGTGEAYAAGRSGFSSGRYLLGADAILLSIYGGMRGYGAWGRTAYRQYAAEHAGLAPNAPTDAGYYAAIGFYDDLATYNDVQLRNRDRIATYVPGSAASWSWDETDSRLHYQAVRSRSETVRDRAQLALLAVGINHLFSGINAARLARQHNRSLSAASTPPAEPHFTLGAAPTPDWSGLQLGLTVRY